MRYLPLLIVLLSVLLVLPPRTLAQNAKGITISPAFLEVALEGKNEKKDISIEITNNTLKEVTLDLYPLDFKQKDEFGAIGFLGLDNSYSYSLSSFLSFETRQLIIKPGEKKNILVSVSNREDLSPGGHYAAVVAKETSSPENQSDLTSISPSLSSLLLIHKKGGERFNLSFIESFYPNGFVTFSYPKFFSIKLQNEGNIHMTPYGKVFIKDVFGRVIYDGMINPSSHIILPESRRVIDVVLTKLLQSSPISLNTITIEGRDSLSETKYAYKDTFLYIHPYFGGGVLALVILAASLYLKRRKHEK